MRIRSYRFRIPHRRGGSGIRHRAWVGRGMASFAPFRTGTSRHWRDKKPPKDDVEALNRKARAMEARLQYLNTRIREIEQGYTAVKFLAVVDAEKCVGCGICMDTCPTGAVLLEEVARTDSNRCIGCGRCVEVCPQGALYLRPAEQALQEETDRVL